MSQIIIKKNMARMLNRILTWTNQPDNLCQFYISTQDISSQFIPKAFTLREFETNWLRLCVNVVYSNVKWCHINVSKKTE